MSETGDGMDHLRIPYEKIKFGKKLESQGYGTVFQGEFDDQSVALKQLNITNLANIKPKLLAEILMISQYRKHPNLVALLGFCDEKSNEIILVYEYVASGNLEEKMRKRLNTIQRFEICLGAARGLDYLHTGGVDPIIHGNIKLSKILLNSDSSSSRFEAKVSSFGLSKIVPGKAALESADVTEKPTKESDVYSFGVLLLEVLCGVSELVDTDDYQERHVSEIVPKKMKQDKLRKTVHFDIRKEIKTEALETYAKIACQCVAEARPQMAQVVVELEKALRLQGGEVTYVQIPGIANETIVEANIPSIEEEEEDDVNAGDKLDDAREAKPADKEYTPTIEEDVQNVMTSGNGDKNSVQAPTNTEDVPNQIHIEDAKNENSSRDHIVTEKGISNDLISKEKSNTMTEFETKEEDTSKITIKDNAHHKEIDPATTGESIHNFESDKKSKVKKEEEEKEEEGEEEDEEEEEENRSMETATTSESSNGGASTNLQLEVHESNILKSDIGSFSEDELDRLRIPFDKIKFGQKIDVHGYGTLFEGEFNHQQVALKRLNITNLGNIKPKLLSAILTISRFRQHPNLVALIGFCDENNKEIIIVYEYVSGGNLADYMSKHLNTIQRLRICLGAARGLKYLHSGDESVHSNPCVIHGNLKLSKILLNSDPISSNFEAKVSGFGLPKLLPGHVEIAPNSTGKLAKESDVYSFGVLLLEVLCGVPELVDTDDYQERHVTELVPKRLEQNMLRKIVHFDIRDEITTESLETYAKIACRSVMKNPEERPTMSEVVVELEKALKLQGGKVSEVQIFGSSNGNGLHDAPVGEDDHEDDDNGEKMSSSVITEEIEENIDGINLVKESGPVQILSSIDVKSVQEDAETQNGGTMNNPESTEEITNNMNSNEEESSITGKNEVDNESKITTSSAKSDNGDDSNPDMGEKVSDVKLLATSNGNSLNEVPDSDMMRLNITEEESKEDAEKENGDNMNAPGSREEIRKDLNSNEESKIIVENEVNKENSAMQEPDPDKTSSTKEKGNGSMMNSRSFHIEQIMEVISNDNGKSNTETIVNIRGGDFGNSDTQNKESKSKRSNSTCSESSNGDETTPSDYLLIKSPDKKKTSRGSGNCCCCCCSCWKFISDSLVMLQRCFLRRAILE